MFICYRVCACVRVCAFVFVFVCELHWSGSYETPSGGDWSVHRGGAVFVDGAEEVVISGCSFEEVSE